MARNIKNPEELFWHRVDKSGTCWLWLGGKDKDGYGKFRVTLPRFGIPTGWPTPQRHLRAHHFSWELKHGATSFDKVIMHSCDTPACVNPEHLRVGTQTENHADMVAKGRIARGDRNGTRAHPESRPRGDNHPSRRHPERLRRGENHPRGTLTAAMVEAIRSQYATGQTTQREIAQSLGVHKSVVGSVLRGKTWRHA